MTDQIILKRAPLDEYILAGEPYYMRNTQGGLTLRVSDYDFYPQGDEFIEEPQLPTEPGSVIVDVVLTNGAKIPLLVRTFHEDFDPWLDPKEPKTGLWVPSDKIKSFTLAKVVPA